MGTSRTGVPNAPAAHRCQSVACEAPGCTAAGERCAGEPGFLCLSSRSPASTPPPPPPPCLTPAGLRSPRPRGHGGWGPLLQERGRSGPGQGFREEAAACTSASAHRARLHTWRPDPRRSAFGLFVLRLQGRAPSLQRPQGTDTLHVEGRGGESAAPSRVRAGRGQRREQRTHDRGSRCRARVSKRHAQ